MSYSYNDNGNRLSVYDSNSTSIQGTGNRDIVHVVGEVVDILDQSTKAEVGVGIQGERTSDKNDIYIHYEKPNGEKLTVINHRKKSGTSFKIVIALCIVFTVIFVMMLTVLSRPSYYIVSSDGTVTAISGDVMEANSSISEAVENADSVIVKSQSLSEKLASSFSWLFQLTPFGNIEPLEGSLSVFHLLLWFNFGCLCIYLLTSIIIGIDMVKKSAGRFIVAIIVSAAILWIAGLIGSWLLTGFALKHSVLAPLFVVLIDAVIGFVLACVLTVVAEECCLAQ